MLILLGLLAAVTAGALSYLLAGPVAAGAVALILVIAGVVAQRGEPTIRRGIGSVLLLTLLGAGVYSAILVIDVLEALNTTEGPADQADPAQLALAEDKLGDVAATSTFRLTLTEPELQAVIQDGLATTTDSPVRRVDVDLRGVSQDLAFTASFKSGDLVATGIAQIRALEGAIDLRLGTVSFDGLEIPGVAAGAIESLLTAITDLNAGLGEQRASVQSVEVLDDLLVVTGTRATTDVLTNADLLNAIRAQAAAAIDQVQAPPERIGQGRVGTLDEPGSPLILAIGDSLAANVGVADARDGFVSRFHRFVADRDGISYGLANLAIPGETSGTLLSGGQLDQAIERLSRDPAAFILLDVGANDLLGHLTSPECSADLTSPGCQQLVGQTLVAYRSNIGRILDRIVDVAGNGRVLFLHAYNPFSLGLGETIQEQESSAILARLNAVATEEASARGVSVADAFTPMQGTTAATTHMLDATPDIHPNAAGYDVLAAALVDAL